MHIIHTDRKSYQNRICNSIWIKNTCTIEIFSKFKSIIISIKYIVAEYVHEVNNI